MKLQSFMRIYVSFQFFFSVFYSRQIFIRNDFLFQSLRQVKKTWSRVKRENDGNFKGVVLKFIRTTYCYFPKSVFFSLIFFQPLLHICKLDAQDDEAARHFYHFLDALFQVQIKQTLDLGSSFSQLGKFKLTNERLTYALITSGIILFLHQQTHLSSFIKIQGHALITWPYQGVRQMNTFTKHMILMK